MTPWTVSRQAPLSMGFSRQEYWSGLPFPSSGDLPHPGTEPTSFTFPALAGLFFTTSATWEGQISLVIAKSRSWVTCFPSPGFLPPMSFSKAESRVGKSKDARATCICSQILSLLLLLLLSHFSRVRLCATP